MKFDAIIDSPAAQFRAEISALLARLLAPLGDEDRTAMEEVLPSLGEYLRAGESYWSGKGILTPADWQSALARIAAQYPDWPMQLYAQMAAKSGFAPLHRDILLSLIMVEEDPGLALLFEAEPGNLSMGGLIARWRTVEGRDMPDRVREALLDLVDARLVVELGDQGLRNDRRFAVVDAVASVLAGMRPRMADAQFVAREQLPDHSEWIPPTSDGDRPEAWLALAGAEVMNVLLLKGPEHNGRKTFAAMMARAAGLNALLLSPALIANPQTLQQAAAVAILAKAVLIAEIDLPVGERLLLPDLGVVGHACLIIACNDSAAVEVSGRATVRAIRIPLPSCEARAVHWRTAGMGKYAGHFAEKWILSAGNIRKAAAAARVHNQWIAKDATSSVQRSLRELRDARLDALASRIDIKEKPAKLFVDTEVDQEIETLITHIAHREMLAGRAAAIGVRALFSGPSGTGKTLAAQHIATRLGKDLFRVDLSAIVNKYIGETEKALERAFRAAEERDIILLLDEGDALMAKRTDVGNSNDRYANLETNFLLQRIENFGGILIVTSNDPERIDAAFTRRLDAIITLRAPDQVKREQILFDHLGAECDVGDDLVRDIACRCTLTGGQIRNVVLHARLLALNARRNLGDDDLRTAVEREYRKIGTPCPLRRMQPIALAS